MKATLLLAVIAAGVLLLARHPAEVSAHATLARSIPVSNDFLRRSPPQIQLDFTEPVQLSASRVRLVDGTGREVTIGSIASSNRDTTVTANVGTLTPGFYNVVWGNVSKVDGHAYQGSFPFTLLNPDGSMPAGQNSLSGLGGDLDPPPLSEGVAVRFLSLLGLLMSLGPAIILLLWRGIPAATSTLLQRVTLVGGAVLAVATMLNLELLSDAFSGTSVPSLVFDTRSGLYWMSRMSAAVLILAVVGLRLAPVKWASIFVLVAGADYLLAFSATSHAAAGAGSRWAGTIDFAHGAAAVAWIGAVVGLALAARATGKSGAYAHVMPRFSLLASISVFILLGTGLFSSFAEISSASQLVETRYGVTLLVKLGAMAVLLLSGLYNALIGRRRLMEGRRDEPRRFVWAATAEVALGLAVFVPAAMLTQTGVAKSVPEVREALVFDRTVQADTLEIRLLVDPNRTGLNTFRVITAPSAEDPGADSVKLTFRYQEDPAVGPSTLSLAPGDDPGEFVGQGAFLNQEGRWRIEAEVRRTGADDIRAFYDVRPAGTAVTTVSRGGPWSNPAAGLSANEFAGLFALFAGLGLFLWRGRVREAAGAPAGWATQALAVTGFGLGFFLVFGVHKDAPRTDLPENPVYPDQNSVAVGRQLYVQNCVQCHGATGIPPKGLDLQPYPLDLTVHVPLHPDGQLFLFIRDGVAGTSMRPWGTGEGKLTDDQMWHLANYLRTLVGTDQ